MIRESASAWGSLLALLAALPILGYANQRPVPRSSPGMVVFICEHGAAKSVIAAAYFNKLAAERHLNFHAIARGLTPQPDLSAAAISGLKKDGVQFPNEKPRLLSPEEAQNAIRVVAFCPLPKALAEARVQTLDVPPPNEDYGTSRDAILDDVKLLIDQLASRQRKERVR